MSTPVSGELASASTDRTRWSSLAALGVLAGGFTAVAGPVGLLAWLLTTTVWYALGTPYALIVGHVVLVALFPAGIDPVSFAVTESGFVVLVLAAGISSASSIRFVVVACASATVIGGVTWLVVRGRPLWMGASVLIGMVAVAVYGIHRYELTRLGLIGDERADARDA